MKKKYKIAILSLDGGGSAGVAYRYPLKALQEEVRKQYNAIGVAFAPSISEIFDYIAGVSVGAIWAGILLTKSLDEVPPLIERMLKVAFSKANWSLFGLLNVKYDNRPLLEELQKLFGDAELINYEKFITLASKHNPDETKKEKSFEIFSGIGAKKDPSHNHKIWEVVAASSAAQTYFLPIEIQSCNSSKCTKDSYSDGGVVANNGALVFASYIARILDKKPWEDNTLCVRIAVKNRKNSTKKYIPKTVMDYLKELRILNELFGNQVDTTNYNLESGLDEFFHNYEIRVVKRDLADTSKKTNKAYENDSKEWVDTSKEEIEKTATHLILYSKSLEEKCAKIHGCTEAVDSLRSREEDLQHSDLHVEL